MLHCNAMGMRSFAEDAMEVKNWLLSQRLVSKNLYEVDGVSANFVLKV
jgi:hypothetical protein